MGCLYVQYGVMLPQIIPDITIALPVFLKTMNIFVLVFFYREEETYIPIYVLAALQQRDSFKFETQTSKSFPACTYVDYRPAV